MAAIQQAGIEVLLELLDLESDGGLRHVEMLGCARERAVLCHRVEYLKSAICHGVYKNDLFRELKHKAVLSGDSQHPVRPRPRYGSALPPTRMAYTPRSACESVLRRLARSHHSVPAFVI